MKHILIFTLSALLCLSMTACGEPIIVNHDAELQPLSEETSPTASADAAAISDSSYMKRLQADASIAKRLTLIAEENYQIEIPFDYESVSYTSDDPLIAAVSSDGIICGKSGGMTLVHIIADDFRYHMMVTVDAPLNTENTSALYTGFYPAAFDIDIAEKGIELYASQCGMVIRSDLETADNLQYTDTFTAADDLSGCDVKYKLLTTVDYLLAKGCTSIDLVIEADSGIITCRFYATQL